MQRVGAARLRAFHDAVLELGSVPLPVVTAPIDRFMAKAPTRIWSEWAAVAGGADAGFPPVAIRGNQKPRTFPRLDPHQSALRNQINLHIRGRAHRPELLSESQVP
jgi:hypothetical protein